MNTAMNNHVKAIDAVAVALVALVLSCMIKDVSSQLDVEFLEPLAAVVNGVTFNLTCKFQYDNDDDIAAMKWEISDKNLERRLDESANQLTDDLLTRHSNGTFSGPGSPRMTSMKLQDGSFQLSVSDVDFTTDEKRYWCYAFVYSRTGGENYHDLNVSVPANSEDVSVYIDGKEITSPSTTLSKQQHEARCEVKGVRPKPLITWSGINEQDSDQNYTVNKENNLLWDSISTVDFTVAKTVILKLTVAVPGEGGIFEKTITLDVQAPADPTNKPTLQSDSHPDGHKPKMIAIGVGCGCGCIIILALVTLLVVRYRKGYSCWDSKPDDCEKTDSTQVPPNPKATPPKQETGQETEPTNRTDDQSRCLLPDGPPQKEEKKYNYVGDNKGGEKEKEKNEQA